MLLGELRHYYKKFRPKTYLFPSAYKGRDLLTYETVRSTYEDARKKAGINKGPGIHTLRHYAEFRIMPSVYSTPPQISVFTLVNSA